MINPSNCPSWAKSLAATQQRFADELQRAGFSLVHGEQKWEGQIEVVDFSGASTSVDLEIEIPDAFPFEPPKVTDISLISAHTWHHNRDWSLCLYGRRHVADRPWQDPAQLLSRVQDWFQNAADGWPDDPPDLDVERYFERVDLFFTYGDIAAFVGKPVFARSRGRNRIHLERAGTVPVKKRSRHKRAASNWWGWAGDIGELDAPVFDWPSVRARLGTDAQKIEKKIRSRDFEFLALRYRRREHQGLLILIPTVRAGRVEVRAARSAADDFKTRRLRAGDPRGCRLLGRRSVAIVGVGAVGSFLADLLARSGIGELHLVDGDLLRPGNCIRHLAGYDHVGCYKTVAVRDLLTAGELMAENCVVTTEKELSPAIAADLLQRADVVVDATADDNVRGLLVHLHGEAMRHGIDASVVSVAVHRFGGIIRSDRWPRGSEDAPEPIPAHPDGELELREGGCGDPVSPTPAAAVVEAAGLACRHIVDLLSRRPELPDSIIQVRIPQPDARYQKLGTLAR